MFVAVSALTGGAVLRAAAHVFLGAGRPGGHRPGPETTGEGEEPEIREPSRRIPVPMYAVPALLPAGSLALGVLPAAARALAAGAAVFTDRAGYLAAAGSGPGAAAVPAPHARWSADGVALGCLSAALAVAVAAASVWGARLPGAAAGRGAGAGRAVTRRIVLPLRRLHSGHIGDYVSWPAAGVAVLLAVLLAQV